MFLQVRPSETPMPTGITIARYRKATLIANVLRSLGATAEQARELPQAGRLAAALLAGKGAPSDETWTLVLAMLDES